MAGKRLCVGVQIAFGTHVRDGAKYLTDAADMLKHCGQSHPLPAGGYRRFAMLFPSVPVEEFTSPDPITATEDMTIEGLQDLMERHDIRHLPVVRGDNVVGMISDRDVRLVSGFPAAEKRQVRAADIMATDPVTVICTTSLDDVAYVMSEKKVGSVIVNDEDGVFIGIFTATDALKALIEIVRGGNPPDGYN